MTGPVSARMRDHPLRTAFRALLALQGQGFGERPGPLCAARGRPQLLANAGSARSEPERAARAACGHAEAIRRGLDP